MIGIQHVPDPQTVDVHEHGLMLPVPAVQHNTVLLESRDGNNIQTLTARAVRLDRNGSTVFRCTNVRISLFITDARVALACSKYDKGGGWIGSPTAMLMLNAASKGLAAARRHGKMMVGQARYPWIKAVGSTARQGIGTEERLILVGMTDSATTLRLALLLPKGVDAATVAADVARRASRHRLAADADIPDDKRAAFQALTSVQPLPPGTKNTIQFHRMPTFYYINDHSARLVPTGFPLPASAAALSPGAQLPTPAPVGPPAAPNNSVGLPLTSRAAPGGRIVISLDDL